MGGLRRREKFYLLSLVVNYLALEKPAYPIIPPYYAYRVVDTTVNIVFCLVPRLKLS